MNEVRLFDPIDVGTLRLRNRWVWSVHHHTFSGHEELHAEPSAGREFTGRHCGLWMLGAGSVHPSSHLEPALFGDSALPLFESLAHLAAREDARVFQCLSHAGNMLPPFDGGIPWAASERPGPTGLAGRAMTPAEIREVRLAFVSAALMCQQGGLDGVQICASEFDLLHQFISESHNDRDDRYGGSCKNRCRILLETVRAVRAAVGPDFAVGVGLGASDGTAFDADGRASNLLLQLESERLIDFVGISGRTNARPEEARRLPRLMTCGSTEQAGQALAAGDAELVSVPPTPAAH